MLRAPPPLYHCHSLVVFFPTVVHLFVCCCCLLFAASCVLHSVALLYVLDVVCLFVCCGVFLQL
eukprot:EC798168.1.p2 GENE.EC798168.1~~EC798168.1.p2  ORF type:complete len:64 (+),score=13.58 EC798168.1:384-575(+)